MAKAKKQSALSKAKVKIAEQEQNILYLNNRITSLQQSVVTANQSLADANRDRTIREQGNVRRLTDSITYLVQTMTGRRVKNLQWEWE
jgi:hypothetical protein